MRCPVLSRGCFPPVDLLLRTGLAESTWVQLPEQLLIKPLAAKYFQQCVHVAFSEQLCTAAEEQWRLISMESHSQSNTVKSSISVFIYDVNVGKMLIH